MKNARDAYAQADYRWAAEILKHIVLNNPQNQQAKDLLANTYRQLGYAAEASTWRNFFLVGAQELQNNVPLQNTSDPSDLLIHTPTERFLEAMATNLDVENLKMKTSVSIWFCRIPKSIFHYGLKTQSCSLSVMMKVKIWHWIALH